MQQWQFSCILLCSLWTVFFQPRHYGLKYLVYCKNSVCKTIQRIKTTKISIMLKFIISVLLKTPVFLYPPPSLFLHWLWIQFSSIHFRVWKYCYNNIEAWLVRSILFSHLLSSTYFILNPSWIFYKTHILWIHWTDNINIDTQYWCIYNYLSCFISVIRRILKVLYMDVTDYSN